MSKQSGFDVFVRVCRSWITGEFGAELPPVSAVEGAVPDLQGLLTPYESTPLQKWSDSPLNLGTPPMNQLVGWLIWGEDSRRMKQVESHCKDGTCVQRSSSLALPVR